jgi:hypothetical protein
VLAGTIDDKTVFLAHSGGSFDVVDAVSAEGAKAHLVGDESLVDAFPCVKRENATIFGGFRAKP